MVDRLANEGVRLVINDLDESPAELAAAAARNAGTEAIATAWEHHSERFREDFVAAALDTFGAIDIVVNNAGYSTYAPAEDTTDADFDAVLDVLLAAPFQVLRAAGKVFSSDSDVQKRPRKVVNVSSIGGLSGAPGQ